jgi:hypothetical protein
MTDGRGRDPKRKRIFNNEAEVVGGTGFMPFNG